MKLNIRITTPEERIADALEKLVEHHQERSSNTLCARCKNKNRCSSCNSPLPVIPELPDMWKEALLRYMGCYSNGQKKSGMDGLTHELERIAIENGYEKCTHGLWVTQEFLEANPSRRVKDDG